MADLFTLADLAAALQVPSVDPVAGDLVRRRVTGRIIAVTGVLGDPPPAAVFDIALTVAVRAYNNPQGLASETIGSYSYTRERGQQGGVYLTEQERRQLRAAVGLAPLNSLPTVGYGLAHALLGTP